MVDKKKKKMRIRFARQQAYQSQTLETKNQTEMVDFNLPNEIWCMIFSYLPMESKKNATVTCKLWFKLIREDQKLSGYILISWHNMEKALDKFQWNWNNWPALKTLELNKLEHVEDSKESIQDLIEKLSLKDCTPRLEVVIFDMDVTPTQTDGASLLKYQPYTDQFFGFGQELDSIQKWKEYETRMQVLKDFKSLLFPTKISEGLFQYVCNYENYETFNDL